MPEQSLNKPLEDEISLKEIIDFLMEFWKTILGVGLLGLLGAIGFLAFMPNQYEATTQIHMAQIPSDSYNGLLGLNVEDPSILIARLQMPSSYTEDNLKACGLDQERNSSEELVKLAKVSVIKGNANSIELRIRLKSKDKVINCSKSLFESIRDHQNNIMKPYIEEATILLLKNQVRLQETQSLLVRADKSGLALSAAYLATRDEVKLLVDENIRLNNLISAKDTRQARLISPIYASDNPVFPKKIISLLVGLLTGLFLGILYVLVRKAFRS